MSSMYVINFSRYVVWPSAEMGESGTPMHVCLLGSDPPSDTLERAVAGRAINGHPLALRRLHQLAEVPGCHLVLIPHGEERYQSQWLPALQNKAILTVGESGHFIRDGGMVNLVLVKGTVRFEVHAEAVQKADLKMSSRMPGLAENVYGKVEEASR